MYPSAEMLRAARALLGLNQEDAAKACKVSPRTLLAVENNRSTLAALHGVMGAYMGLGIRFDATADYGSQTVSILHRNPPGPPPIPEE